MSEWEFYSCDLCRGNIVEELPLVSFGGGRKLNGGGQLSARMPLAHIGSAATRQHLLDVTNPGRYSIVARRDGVLVGEWAIWRRTRADDFAPVQLVGEELLSVLNRRVTPAWTWTATEQLTIARDMAVYGFTNGPMPFTITIPAITPSGQLRDRVYTLAQGNIGTRLGELADVANGFEYYIDTVWGTRIYSNQELVRTLNFYYPRAGIDQPLVFDLPGPMERLGGNVATMTYDESGGQLASKTYAIGAQVAGAVLMGTVTGTGLTAQGYPLYERTGSWTDVVQQPTINAYAQGLYDDSQSAAVTFAVTVLADTDPRYGEYSLGDRVTLAAEPSINFPNGFYAQVRIVGWQIGQDDSGPETVTLDCVTATAPVSMINDRQTTVSEQVGYLSTRVRTLEVKK